MSELCFLSAVELSKLIHEGKISSEELVKSYIKRIEEIDKNIHAWAHFDKEALLAAARESDDYRISGKPIGPLHGVPIGIKDIFGTDSMPTQCGTILREGVRSKDDCEVVNLLKNSGALVMGKTVTTEFAYFDPGKTTNPHDFSRTPGGSSSGSAAAVASFMAPVAIGSQTNGSVIRPASYCGVIGYKPTYGLISRHGVMKQSHLLDHVGIFSRSIEDLTLIAREIIKKDLQDKSTVAYSVNNIMEIVKSKPPFDPKFVFFKTSKWKNLDKESIKSFESFIKKLEGNIKVIDAPAHFDKIFEYHQIIHETDMAYSFSDFYEKRKTKLGKKLVEAIERGQKYKARDYTEACENRDYFYQQFQEVFHEYHAVLSPAATGVAPKGLEYTGSPEFSTIWTYLGMPSISLPLLEGSNNLPLGVQIIGEKFDDPRLMRTASWLIKNFKKGKK